MLIAAASSMGKGQNPDKLARDFDKIANIGKRVESPLVSLSGTREDIVACSPASYGPSLPTGIDELDSMCGGGLPFKKLGCVIANSNDGKSFFLGGVYCEALLLQYNALYITLEMEEEEIKERMYRNLCDMTSTELAENPDEAASRFSMLKEYTDRYKASPQVVIIDYCDLVVSTLNESKRENAYKDQGVVYAKLRSMAIQHGWFLWTASQAVRAAIGKKHIGREHASDSLEKVRKADFMTAICRDDKDRVANMFRLSNPKRRQGQILPDIGPFHTDWDYGRMTAPMNRVRPWEEVAA
jgi:hypothetical protein